MAPPTRAPARDAVKDKPGGVSAPRLPDGFHMSTAWLDSAGRRIEGAEKIPINSVTLRPAGTLWLCAGVVHGCPVGEWVIDTGDPDAELKPTQRYCPKHGCPLRPQGIDDRDPHAVTGARSRMAAAVSAALRRRREQAGGYAAERLLAARQALMEAGKSTAADYAGHTPSAVGAVAAIVAGTVAAERGDLVTVTLAATAFAVAGLVVAYALTFIYHREQARLRGQRVTGNARALQQARAQARAMATGVAAAGVWTAADAAAVAAGHGLGTALGTLMLGVAILAAWYVCRGHWEQLSAERRRLRELARQRAQEAVVEAEVEVRRATEPPPPPPEPELVFDENDPAQVGARMAQQWTEISRHPDVPQRFAVMPRARILPELTRAVMAPSPDGGQRRIGWEFMIQGEPGVLVPPVGAPSPVIAARLWLAGVMGRDPMSVALVERPDNDINRAVLLLTDGAPLGEPVPYLGRAGIQVLSNGTILGHDGRDIKGRDTFMPLYISGQPFGGVVLGRSGGGKSQARRVRILNNLYAGIFTTMYDPKNFVDYSEFAGVIPMGCTVEHRDVILRSLWAEMVRRQQMLSQLVGRDRHGRVRPIEGAWNIERDGAPILSMWDEFHLESKDPDYVARLTTLARLVRATASGIELASQGGGLADLGDSVLRMLMNQIGMEIYRMALSQARLGGYTGGFDPNDLPSLPGTVLKTYGEAGTPIPMRSAFVSRDDVDGSVYDHLYAPDGSQILFAPVMPDATVEVFEREGLMDLWRMGQGPGGLARLQAGNGDSTVPPPGAVTAAGGGGKPIEGREMILAILAAGPVRDRQQADNHPMWLQDPGRDKLPSPSTISRPLAQLEREGLVRNPNRDDVWRELTDAGRRAGDRALQAFYVAVGRAETGAAVPGTGDPQGPAATERRALAEQEQKQLVAAEVAATEQ
jgi:hypothetical protein